MRHGELMRPERPTSRLCRGSKISRRPWKTFLTPLLAAPSSTRTFILLSAVLVGSVCAMQAQTASSTAPLSAVASSAMEPCSSSRREDRRNSPRFSNYQIIRLQNYKIPFYLAGSFAASSCGSSAFCQPEPGSYSFIAFATTSVFLPRSFWCTTPSSPTINVITPDDLYSAG